MSSVIVLVFSSRSSSGGFPVESPMANDPESSRFLMLFAMPIKEEGPIPYTEVVSIMDSTNLSYFLLESPTLARSDRVQLEFAEFEHS
jgi:hypothetical protein